MQKYLEPISSSLLLFSTALLQRKARCHRWIAGKLAGDSESRIALTLLN